jgi:hypothetical protein
MLRASKNTTGAIPNQPTDSEEIKEDIPVKQSKPTVFRRRIDIVIGVLIYIIAAGGIASHYITSHYNEKLESRYKQYGSNKKPCAVIIPGLDGSASFYKVCNTTHHFFIIEHS